MEGIATPLAVPKLQLFAASHRSRTSNPHAHQSAADLHQGVGANLPPRSDDPGGRDDESAALLQGLDENQFLGRVETLVKAADGSKDIGPAKEKAAAHQPNDPPHGDADGMKDFRPERQRAVEMED